MRVFFLLRRSKLGNQERDRGNEKGKRGKCVWEREGEYKWRVAKEVTQLSRSEREHCF